LRQSGAQSRRGASGPRSAPYNPTDWVAPRPRRSASVWATDWPCRRCGRSSAAITPNRHSCDCARPPEFLRGQAKRTLRRADRARRRSSSYPTARFRGVDIGSRPPRRSAQTAGLEGERQPTGPAPTRPFASAGHVIRRQSRQCSTASGRTGRGRRRFRRPVSDHAGPPIVPGQPARATVGDHSHRGTYTLRRRITAGRSGFATTE